MSPRPPAPRPCISCPYRRDVPSGIWDESEYEKLVAYDVETPFQPPSVFDCHQQDGRLCAGWVAVHDMEQSLGFRLMARIDGELSDVDIDAILDYETDVPLFSSGREAAEHGMRDINDPGESAIRLADRVRRKRDRR